MYVCIHVCVLRERREERQVRLWGVACAEPTQWGRCGGPAPVLAEPQPAPIPFSLMGNESKRM
ncbi:hypothetical protein HanIR_Chr16g0833901 [Helianthus annuus]|nr:hypothetical protein HanIR_Chr16g0833901 [Helianthus annuus]